MERRLAQIEESVARYLRQLDSADRQEPSEAREIKTIRLKEKIAKLRERLLANARMLAARCQTGITAGIPDSRYGDERPRLVLWATIRPGRCRHRASSDHHARGDIRSDHSLADMAKGPSADAGSGGLMSSLTAATTEKKLACELNEAHSRTLP